MSFKYLYTILVSFLISKKFIKTSFIYTVAGALPMASAIILLPFYIHYLPTEVYGALAICLAFAVFVQIMTTYSFDNSLFIHYHEFRHDKAKLSSFVSSAFIFMLGLGLVIAAVLTLGGQLIFDKIIPNSTLSFFPYGLVSIGIGIFQAIFKVHGNLLQTREKSVTFLWSHVSSFGIIAVTTIVGLKLFPGTLIGPLGGRLLAAFLSANWALFRVFREFGFHFKSPWENTSRSFNAYSFIYQLQQWVINYVDRFIILVFMPVAAMASLGIYEFAIKCLAPIELVMNGLNASVFPQITKLINKQEGSKSSSPEINRYSYGQLSVMMMMICLAILFLPWAIDLFIKKTAYAQALRYAPFLAVIFIFRSMRLYFVVPYNVLKKMKTLTALNLVTSLVKIGLMIILIAKWQLFGIIISTILTYALEMILLWVYLKDDYTMKFNAFKLMIGPFFLFFVIVLIEPFFGATYPTLIHLGYGCICAALLWFSYRNELKLIIPSKFLK